MINIYGAIKSACAYYIVKHYSNKKHKIKVPQYKTEDRLSQSVLSQYFFHIFNVKIKFNFISPKNKGLIAYIVCIFYIMWTKYT